MTGAVLHIRQLGIRLSPDFAVMIDRLDLGPGDRVVLDAVSGAGKSTALGLIAAALPALPAEGRAHVIAGRDVATTRARRDSTPPEVLGFVLQTNPLVPYITIRDNITLPLDVVGGSLDRDWFDHLTGALGLEPLLLRKPAALSVGQRQRVAIARAMLARPALLLLDEPVSALDPANAATVEDLIDMLAREAGSAVVLASHQAQSGAFAATPRLRHSMVREGPMMVSVFAEGTDAAIRASGAATAREEMA